MSSILGEFDSFSDVDAVSALEGRIAQSSGGTQDSYRFALLQLLSKRHIRRPELVVSHGCILMISWAASQPSEYWGVIEDVGAAAADVSDHKLLHQCVAILTGQFPNSSRVHKLAALQAEALGEWDTAIELYKRLAASKPSQGAARKRLAAVYKAQGKLADALRELSEYTSVFSEDVAAWSELYSLYTQTMRPDQAKFAAEELVLLKPHCWTYHVFLADTLYGLGGRPNVAQARSHYAQALELKPEGNLRAVYGLILCLKTLGFTMPHHEGLYAKLGQYALASSWAQGTGASGGMNKALVQELLRYDEISPVSAGAAAGAADRSGGAAAVAAGARTEAPKPAQPAAAAAAPAKDYAAELDTVDS